MMWYLVLLASAMQAPVGANLFFCLTQEYVTTVLIDW